RFLVCQQRIPRIVLHHLRSRPEPDGNVRSESAVRGFRGIWRNIGIVAGVRGNFGAGEPENACAAGKRQLRVLQVGGGTESGELQREWKRETTVGGSRAVRFQ